jgi:Xaa-Pro aminopeptidase
LKPLPNPAPPITDDERRARIAKAQKLMNDLGLGAIVLESGTSMAYFTNVRWGLSERPFLLVMPAKGELAWISPAFEEARARELIKFSNDVRVWQEDEDATALVAGVLKDRGVSSAKIGIEERVRFFIADALHHAIPSAQIVLATPVTAGCRTIKSAADIACLQYANDITLAAYKAGLATMHEGMTQGELGNNITAAFRQMGAGGGLSVMFGKYTAFPHGSIEPQRLKEGDIVMIDDGVTWEGYQSDITRTTVFGKPSQRQIDVWNMEKKAQAAAFAAAQVGSDVRVGGRSRAQGDHRGRLRSRIQGAGSAPSHGSRHRDGRPRVDELRQRQHDEDSAGDVLQRRADDRDLRRVRHPAGGLSSHHAGRPEVFHEAERGDRSAVWVRRLEVRGRKFSGFDRSPLRARNAGRRRGNGVGRARAARRRQGHLLHRGASRCRAEHARGHGPVRSTRRAD